MRTFEPDETSEGSSVSTRALTRGTGPAFVLDERTVWKRRSRHLIGGEPARLVRLSEAADSVLAVSLSRRPALSAREARAMRRLIAGGLVHPRPIPREGPLPVEVTIPSFEPGPTLGRLVADLSAGSVPVVVVDDASPDGARASETACGGRARLVRRETRGGPAAARMSAVGESEFVAFVDADIELDPSDALGWIRTCLAHFDDESVGAVAPRVVARRRGGEGAAISSYEELESPLDMGESPGIVGSGRRHTYVPSAALMLRKEAFQEVGGFDPSLYHGEDVDLVRRLEKGGWTVRYEPAVTVFHSPRASTFAFARQRFSYGRSAAVLHRRHPGTVAPYTGSAVATTAGLALLAAAIGRRPVAWLLVAGACTAAVWGSLARIFEADGVAGSWSEAAASAVSSSASATGGLLAAIRRAWWPFLAPFVVCRRTRRRALALLLGAFGAGHGGAAVVAARRERHLRRFVSHVLLALLDDASYGAGVVVGCVAAGSPGALRPVVRWRPTGRRAR